jgi:hypothetical protein
MAGIRSTDGNQRLMVINLINIMERANIGNNAAATRRALEMVYKRQGERFMNTGHSLDVDCVDLTVE